MSKYLKLLTAVLFVGVFAAACAQDNKMAAKAAPAEKDIVVTAVEAGKFNTLVAAVKAADLVETLQSPGPFTVFAPTDAAFDKLPAGTVEDLLKPENKAKLVEILTYHVVSGVVPASAVVGKKVDADSVQGSKIMIDGMDGVVLNGSAKVVTADVIASNGVIHVIDTVILPPAN
ncbi:fasciclin domain-containing protein [Sneathiella sp. CAU 1612]|uniref:Fasciclin domain-containing protein n=1 Tax=Sneathiella sedimenti TaxID=2816034 RepID=A0ABS3FAB1_9PROT|nr:fasciclin domain-containing protein [Sneathiella sedimenti]MBO0334887.1 fasciclin domain-containing protein [Sneathiella sedimenti]